MVNNMNLSCNEIQEEIKFIITCFGIEMLMLKRSSQNKEKKDYCKEVDLIADKYRNKAKEAFSDKQIIWNISDYINNYLLNDVLCNNENNSEFLKPSGSVFKEFNDNEVDGQHIMFDLPKKIN